jgi:hypothetical protein
VGLSLAKIDIISAETLAFFTALNVPFAELDNTRHFIHRDKTNFSRYDHLKYWGGDMRIPPEVPERLRDLAANLSWHDCVNLLNLYEGWSQTEKTTEIRARSGKLADDMRVLVNALPYEWEVPPVKEHGPITAIAEMLRTGVMPPAPERYRNNETNPILKSRKEKEMGENVDG